MDTPLKIFFKKNGIKPTPWAEKHNIAPAVISRYLNGRGISKENALKISQASFGEVSVMDILYPKNCGHIY
jgi:hypothetical protein